MGHGAEDPELVGIELRKTESKLKRCVVCIESRDKDVGQGDRVSSPPARVPEVP